MPESRILTGGCACRQLTFETRGAPKRVGLCHCMTCRKESGGPFNAFAIFPVDQVTISGEMRGWSASPDGERCFCPICGSQVFYKGDGNEIEVKLGAFDETNLFTPTYETWTKRREGWLRTTDLQSFPENRGEVS
jgi:hypothetical protein